MARHYNNPVDIGIPLTFSNLATQSYQISLDLSRIDVTSMGYKLPIDRVIQFPLYVQTNINVLVGDTYTGSIHHLFKVNDDYDLTIKIRNPYGKGEIPTSGIAVQYHLIRSKLVSYNYDSTIGSNKSLVLNFITEIDPDDLSRGLFMSGLLNIDSAYMSSIGDNFVTDTGEDMVTETGEIMVANTWVLFY